MNTTVAFLFVAAIAVVLWVALWLVVRRCEWADRADSALRNETNDDELYGHWLDGGRS